MNKLNVVIIVVLVLFTVFHFLVGHDTDIAITKLNTEIEQYEYTIDSVEYNNAVISNTVFDLKDSIITYKVLIESYSDSLIKIKDYYEKQSDEVAALNDSSSYVFFREYIERNAPRFGITFD